MNIQQAKDEIKRSINIYLMKDEYGNYRIPIERQRPLFMVGAPGIGKTAIMQQIAQELGVGLVSYSMTHHTRQSALGLPFIEKREYEGKEFDVSVYTLSEILASVYETMKKSGKKEGILFLDEINCVSETLGPSMLQFLQYKTFGNHQLPEGWVVVTAGNPPEFNRAVHAFDVATLDRLKVLNVQADFNVWKEYAQNKKVHKAILTYLEIHRADFFDIETTVSGKNFVTARGWEDLSEAIVLYEELGYDVNHVMIREYLQNDRIADDFATYYELFCKYRSDYQILKILEGNVEDEIKIRAKKAGFDERISVVNLMLEALMPKINHNVEMEDGIKMILPKLRLMKELVLNKQVNTLKNALNDEMQAIQLRMAKEAAASGLSERYKHIYGYCLQFYGNVLKQLEINHYETIEEQFNCIQSLYMNDVTRMKEDAVVIQKEMHEVFKFTEENFTSSHEVLLLVTQLTVNTNAARFIAEHGCDDYYRNNEKLMVDQRNKRIMDALEKYAEKAKQEGTFEL